MQPRPRDAGGGHRYINEGMHAQLAHVAERHWRARWVLLESLDDLVGASDDAVGDCDPERFCGLQVHLKFQAGGLFHWQVSRVRASQYFVNVNRYMLE